MRITLAAARHSRERQNLLRAPASTVLTPAGPPVGPIRPLTAQQERVVDGVRRGRSYAEIGSELDPPIDRETVKGHVIRIAALLRHLADDDAELEPRDLVFRWAWWRWWAARRSA